MEKWGDVFSQEIKASGGRKENIIVQNMRTQKCFSLPSRILFMVDRGYEKLNVQL